VGTAVEHDLESAGDVNITPGVVSRHTQPVRAWRDDFCQGNLTVRAIAGEVVVYEEILV
jgi:hypothetical protein